AQGGNQRLQQRRLLLGEDGAQIEQQPIALDARNHGNSSGRLPQASLKLDRRITGAGDAQHGRRQRLRGSGAAANQRTAIRDFDLGARRGGLQPERFAESLRARSDFLERQADHALRGNIFPRTTEIRAQGHLQSRNGQLVHAQGPEERMPPHLRDALFLPGDNAGLRPAQQFVRAEEHQRKARRYTFAHGGFRDAAGGETGEASRAQVLDDGQAGARAERDQVRYFGLFREAGHGKIRGMHAEEQARFIVDGVFIVGQARAVRRAHLAQDRAALLHDFRDAKAIADFDQFAARDDDFAASRQGRERQQHGRRAIVHHNGRFRAGQALDQARRVYVAFSACPGLQIVFQIGVLRGRAAKLLYHLGGKRGAAEIGVQNYARSVDHRLQGLCEFLLYSIRNALFDGGGVQNFIG